MRSVLILLYRILFLFVKKYFEYFLLLSGRYQKCYHNPMRLFFIFLFCALCFAAPAWAHGDEVATVVNDPVEAKKLLGKHLFNENILSDYQQVANHVFGEADITEKDGIYSLRADQACYQRDYVKPYRVYGGHVKITGVISQINPNSFIVNGHIEASTDEEFRGESPDPMHLLCSADAIFRFSRENHAAYWRIQNHNISCVKELDDINIFSAPLHGKPPEERCGHSMKESEDMSPDDFFR